MSIGGFFLGSSLKKLNKFGKMKKTQVLYSEDSLTSHTDINAPGVRYVAIHIPPAHQPYVWCTYVQKKRLELPTLSDDTIIFAIEQAKQLFDFKEFNIENLVEGSKRK